MKWKYIVLIIIGTISIICVPFIIDSNITTDILAVLQTFFSFVTLIVAITLYDKYQAGTKLNNQTINLIVDYITFLKKSELLLEIYINSEKIGFKKILFDKNNNGTNDCIDLNMSSLYIYFGTYIGFNSELERYINSPWMPKEIYDKSKFFLFNGSKTYSINKLKGNYCILNFPGYKDYDFKYKGPEKLIMLDNVETVEELEKNINILLKSIENWIKKQARDINIRM